MPLYNVKTWISLPGVKPPVASVVCLQGFLFRSCECQVTRVPGKHMYTAAVHVPV